MTATKTPAPSVASLASACEIAHGRYLRAMASAAATAHRYAASPITFEPGSDWMRLKRARAQAYGRLHGAKARLDTCHEALFNALYRGDA